MDDHPTSRNAAGVFEPFEIARVPWETFGKGERFEIRYQHLSSFGGGTQVGVSMEILPPGKQANQSHYHMLEEEHVMVLEGSMTLRLGERPYVLTVGHYVCFPAGQRVAHALFNHTAEPCRYLVFGSTNPHDVIVYPDSGRVGVRLAGTGYRAAATMEYWEDVDVDRPR
jgi:uncharacterized cupin superfamily protein